MLTLDQSSSVSFTKEVVVPSNGTSDPLYINGSARESIKICVIPGSGASGTIEQTISPIGSIKDDSANWVQVGSAVNTKSIVSIPTPITGLRFKATVAAVTFEVLAACL